MSYIDATHRPFAIFFASRAFAPNPGAWLPRFPSGACGWTILAAWDGLWSGWMGVPLGESLGVDIVEDMADSELGGGSDDDDRRLR